MQISLQAPLAPDSAAGDLDVRQLKKALNRLGFYAPPHTDIGITGLTDNDLFAAIRAYQSARGLPVTGQVKPDDETLGALNADLASAPDGYYIWRTVGDDKVRSEHARYNGTVRAWNDTPGPGEDYNCRCWAEKIVSVHPLEKKWSNANFIMHFYKGNGRAVNLDETGLLTSVAGHVDQTVYPKVREQIIKTALATREGRFTDYFENWYDFKAVSYSLGRSTLKGNISGDVRLKNGIYIITVRIEYLYFDQFTDPFSIRQNLRGTSYRKNKEGYSDIGGVAYDIVGRWIKEETITVPSHDGIISR